MSESNATLEVDKLVLQLVPVFGQALFGKQWQADLSRELGISKSLLSRALRDQREPPPRLAHKVKEVVLTRVCDAFTLLDNEGMPYAGTSRMAEAQDLMTKAIDLLRNGAPAAA